MLLFFVAQIINGKTPQFYVIIFCCWSLAPPKPLTVMLMPRAKNNRYLHTVNHQTFIECDEFIQIIFEQFVLRATGNNLRHCFDAVVTMRTAGDRIDHMPTNGSHAAALKTALDRCTHKLKTHTIKIFRAVFFQPADIPTVNGW